MLVAIFGSLIPKLWSAKSESGGNNGKPGSTCPHSQIYLSTLKAVDQMLQETVQIGKSLVWGEKLVGAATIMSDSRV